MGDHFESESKANISEKTMAVPALNAEKFASMPWRMVNQKLPAPVQLKPPRSKVPAKRRDNKRSCAGQWYRGTATMGMWNLAFKP